MPNPWNVANLTPQRFEKGDALFFCSHKYHNVEPVTRGRRMVLVAELWVGPEKECAHRCLTAADECGYSLERNHLATYVQQLAMLAFVLLDGTDGRHNIQRLTVCFDRKLLRIA